MTTTNQTAEDKAKAEAGQAKAIAEGNVPASGKSVTLGLHRVAITRGRDEITTSVPKHEIEVLKVVHGEGNVREIELDEDERGDIELDQSAEAEFARMQRKYRRINTPDAVRVAFPHGASDVAKFGFKTGGGAAQKPPQASVRNRKAEAKKAAKKAAGK